MKTLALAILLLAASSSAVAQNELPLYVRNALARIETAFRAGSPESIDDLLGSPMTIRLGDSLYYPAFGGRPLALLKNFFADKDSIEFHFGIPGTGRMIYSVEGVRDTTIVDVFFSGSSFQMTMYALNISNYPRPMIFMKNIHFGDPVPGGKPR